MELYEKIYKNFLYTLTTSVEICRITLVRIGKGLLLRNSRQDQTSIYVYGTKFGFFYI